MNTPACADHGLSRMSKSSSQLERSIGLDLPAHEQEFAPALRALLEQLEVAACFPVRQSDMQFATRCCPISNELHDPMSSEHIIRSN